MIRTSILAAAVALFMSATAALSFQQTLTVQFAGIDLNPDGNSGTAIAAVDTCRSVNLGDSFQIDVVIKGVPPLASTAPGQLIGGIAGFGYNIHFDPAVINITAATNSYMIQSSAPFEYIAANYTEGGNSNGFPATTGNTRIDYLNVGNQNYPGGDGVLSRLTISAVGAGSTELTLDDIVDHSTYPAVYGGDTNAMFINTLGSAVIKVGSACASGEAATPAIQATPTPTPTPAPTPTPPGGTPVVVPAGNTQLAIDAITTGNEPTKLGPIDSCASATVGEKFLVDVVIKDVTNLLAWELPVSFDKRYLRIESRDVQQFQAANDNSKVIDASQNTPNDSGVYVASALDSADPVSPDSGSGVLVRLTLTAVAAGASSLTLIPVDINNDNKPDRGILLKNSDNAIIGDTNGDTFFDGPAQSAEIRVGAECPGGGGVVQAGDAPRSNGGSSNDWVYIAIAAAAVAVVAGAGAGLLLMRRKRGISS